jgi:hypothetical protein
MRGSKLSVWDAPPKEFVKHKNEQSKVIKKGSQIPPGGIYDRSGGDAYSSMAPDPTSNLEVRVHPFSDLYFLYDLWDWLLFVISSKS